MEVTLSLGASTVNTTGGLDRVPTDRGSLFEDGYRDVILVNQFIGSSQPGQTGSNNNNGRERHLQLRMRGC